MLKAKQGGKKTAKTLFVFLGVALAAGAAMALQGSLNTVLGKIIGLLEATLVVHGVGLAALLVALFVCSLGRGDLTRIGDAPWYTFLGGILVVIIVAGVVASISRLGVAAATAAIIVGQVATALVVDHFGFFGLPQVPFSWWKAVGLVLLALGAKLVLG